MPCPTSPSPAQPAAATPGGALRARGAAVRIAALTLTSTFAATLTGFAGLAGPLTAAAAEPATATTGDPLQLRLDGLTPSTVDADTRRAVKLTGTVTNVSNETWTAVNLAPFRSAYPITDSTGLTAAAATADTDYVGDRLTAVSSLTTVDSLAPGQSARFTATIPRSALGSSPGVYWVGVHASGQTETIPRDDITDGRTRTFLPVSTDSDESKGSKAQRTSLVLPVRTEVRHAADGTLTDVDNWTASLSDGGELDELLEAGAAAGSHSVSWLVDPAVPHAVAQLAAGNPGWDLSADPEQVVHLPEASASASPDPDAEKDTEKGSGSDGEDGADSDEATSVVAARAWLKKFTALLGAEGSDVHSLPYGDVDVAALARRSPASVVQAQTRGVEVMKALGIDSTPAVAPVEGVLPSSVLALLDSETLVLLRDDAVTTDAASPVPGAGTVLGRAFVTTSAGATQGGPGPESPGTALAVRQRVLSEAVVRQLNGDSSALVVMPPDGWEAAEGTAALADSFDDSDLRARSLSEVADAGDATLEASALAFSKEQRSELLPRANVGAVLRLSESASLLDSVLERSAGLDVQATDVGWSDLAYASRRAPEAARLRTSRTQQHLDELTGEVAIEGPAVVTLSGSSGRIGATVTNNLPVPVKVDVEAVSGESIQLDVPNPVRVAPNSRNRLLLQADRVQQGVSSVTLQVKTLDGRTIGAKDSFPVRSSQVSGILWLVIGGGAVVLFGAIAIRFFRRGLASRREQGVT